MAMKIISVSDIGDFKLGNAEDSEKGTGCTVIICEKGAVGGVDVRGGGPATRETDLLRSENTVNAVNAVVLSGGSAFGLEAASGVMRELSERKIGFDVGDDIIVPIVCGASLYDLPIGDHKAFPDVRMGTEAVQNAYEGVFSNGNHGAGTGATVGKMKGYERAMKTGLGTFACGDGVIEVGAIAAVNAVGDIYNGAGNIIAGLRSEDGESIYGTIKTLKGMVHDNIRLVDDSTSFINRSDIEEALAAAARQFEEENPSSDEQASEITEDVTETVVVPAEETTEEILEEPEEILEEETVEAPEEEFVPDTPAETAGENSYMEYDEISIPIASAEAEVEVEVPQEAASADPSEEKLPENEPEITEDVSEATEDESENASIPSEETSKEIFEEPEAEETSEETAVPEETSEEETAEEQAEDKAEEEQPEEPAVLTREEMGYDIVFNTTISCLITNAALTKSQANKLASILHDAYARAIKPVHGTLDGDTVFVLATGKQKVNFDAFAALATDVMQYAIIDGAMSAEGAFGLPAARDMQ